MIVDQRVQCSEENVQFFHHTLILTPAAHVCGNDTPYVICTELVI
jgi:hypothetical protein